MALKFLNKKGWHTGSLRNIENVWKAEQKHNEEERKLEELRKQIAEEREKSEFRELQIQAGLIPRQERLDFLYDSGLACGKSSEGGFKTLEALPKSETNLATAAIAATSNEKEKSSAPGALFEEKPQSANDAWRKLHSDPLLLIKQREQEALARIKNNPVQMANIRKAVVEKKKGKEKSGEKKEHKKRSHKSSKHEKCISSKGESSDDDDEASEEEERRRRRSQHYDRKKVEQYSSRGRSDSDSEEKRHKGYDKYSSKSRRSDDGDYSEGEERKRTSRDYDRKKIERYSSHGRSDSEDDEKRKRGYDRCSSKSRRSENDNASDGEKRYKRSHHHDRKEVEQYSSHGRSDAETEEKRKRSNEKYSSSKVERSEKDGPSEREERNKRTSHYNDRKPEPYSSRGRSDFDSEEIRRGSNEKSNHERHSTQIMEAPRENSERSQQRQRRPAPKLSEEEKAARLREMQLDAELHEEQRWKRLKKASENDAREASLASSMGGRNFLDAAQTSIYGAEKGGSSTIEESVRRRKHYSQGQSESNIESNAFRR